MEEKEESRQPQIKFVLAIGGGVVLALILIVSQVTAKSIGKRTEALIMTGQLKLDTILDQYSSQISSIVLGSEPRPESLVQLVRNHFVAPPQLDNDQDFLEWMKNHDIAMSDLRDEKIQQLLSAGRKAYQEQRRSLRVTEHAYHEAIDSLYSGLWLNLNGYPTLPLNKQ